MQSKRARMSWKGSDNLWRRRHLWYRYGLTLEEVKSRLAAQGGRCSICEKLITLGRGRTSAHVDHDHDTGRFRGMLCYPCNAALEWFINNQGAISDYLY